MDGLWKTVIIVLILLIVSGMVILLFDPLSPSEIVITPGIKNERKAIGIYGAVKTPGVYEYSGGLRVFEAVEMAGGLAPDADPAYAELSKWVADGETLIIPTVGKLQPTLTPIAADMVNLNTADKKQLMELPGIGEKRAEEILKLREEKGGFSCREDLLEISGISERLLESIYDLIIVQ
ncbi:MAG: ComEA family DNA-binding protein [Anaerolineaceae bacterium]|nr:ComEA family DNA-binding protein [Anaerolineaceae bacterium]